MRAEAKAWDTRPGDQRDGLDNEFMSLQLRDAARDYLSAAGDDDLKPIGDHGLQYICRSGSSIAGQSPTLSANVVPTPSGRSFVATAMPNSDSMYDMLTAMVEKRAQNHPLYQKPESSFGENDVVIIQLTNEMDGAGPYLPTATGVTHTYKPEDHTEGNSYSLELLEPRINCKKDGVINSEVKISTTRSDGQTVDDLHLHHFQYTLWPDCGVPEDPGTLVELVELVNDIQDRAPGSQIWVHCMAGAGRTGTLISLASLLSDRQAGTKSTKLPSNSRHSDPVYATVDSIRDYRSRQVLTPGQLGLIHDIVDSKNGVPFSSIKRTAPADSAITTPKSCRSEAHSSNQPTMSTAAVAFA